MLHHSGVSLKVKKNQFAANNSYHKAKWQFKSKLGYYLGYNYEINGSGKVYKAREEGERTAACYQKSMNNGQCIHICIEGNFDIEKPHEAQIFALRDLLRGLVKKYEINKKNILFHGHIANKTCPGKNMDLVFVKSLVSGNALKEAVKEKGGNFEIIKLLKKALELLK